MQLNESSLKRLENHMLKHDTALISAMCSKSDCGMGDPISKRENRDRVAKLEQVVMFCSGHYSSTKVYGGILKNESDEIHENTLFMVDLKGSGNLKNDVKKWGAEFQQGSVIFIQAGLFNGQMIGTSKCDNTSPAFDEIVDIGEVKLGKVGITFTGVDGRPFAFEEKVLKNRDKYSHVMGGEDKDAPYYIFEYFGDFSDQDHD